MYKVILHPLRTPFTCAPGQTLKDAAVAQGSYTLPMGCNGGSCGVCKARILSGEADPGHVSQYVLSSEEREEGIILLCTATPLSDLELVYLNGDE